MFSFGTTTTSSSSPSNSLPPTPKQGAAISAPVVLDNETSDSPFGPPMRKRLDSSGISLNFSFVLLNYYAYVYS